MWQRETHLRLQQQCTHEHDTNPLTTRNGHKIFALDKVTFCSKRVIKREKNEHVPLNKAVHLFGHQLWKRNADEPKCPPLGRHLPRDNKHPRM